MNNRKYSLYFLLGIIIVVTVVSIMSIHAAYTYRVTKSNIIKDLDEHASFNIIYLDKNIVNLMAAYSANEYDKIVMSEMERHDNFAIIVEDYKMGKIFGMQAYVSGKIRDDQRNIVDYDPKNSEHNKRLSGCIYSKKHDIKGANGEIMGSLRIYNSDYRVNKELNRIILESVVNTFSISLALILALFALIRLVVLRPLSEMMQSIKKTGEDGLPLEAIVKEGASEIFLLTDTINKMIGVARNSNKALKEQQKETNELKERLEYAVTGTRDGLWDWDVGTDHIYFSPRFKELMGYKEDELPDSIKAWEERIHPDDKEKVQEAIALSHSKPGNFYENTHRVLKKDGSYIWVLDRAQTIFNKEGKAVRMVGFYTDITKQKQLEQELVEQENLMLAQSRHVAMGEMIGMIAHQWRQPITVIAMGANNVLADIALEDVSIERFKQEAQDILKQTEYLSKTIDDFRNFFRPNQEKDELKVEDVLLEAKQIMGKSLEYHNIVLSIVSDEHEAIHTYSRDLLQVILNLLKNSKEAFETSMIENAYINVSVESLDNAIVIRVCDNGGGIDASIIDRIFEPYFSTKDKKTGTGLGLYMSKTIVEKHLNGTITATNTNDGVCFTITISKTKGQDV